MRLVQVVPSLEGGGAEEVAKTLAVGLAERGHESAVVSLYAADTSSPIRRHLVKCGVTVAPLSKRPGPSPQTVTALRSWLRAYAPDIVNTHIGGFLYGFPAALRSGIPVVHTVHNDPRHEVSFAMRRLHAQAYRLGAHGVVLSERFVEPFHAVHSRSPSGVVPNGVDSQTFRGQWAGPPAYAVSPVGRPGPFRVVVIGRLEAQKRVDVFLEALSDVVRESPDPVEARILGSGSLRSELEEMAARLGLAPVVDFRGRVDDVASHLDWADALALSSDYEGMPLVVVEAMAAGIPVVATRVGAVPDMVLDGTTGFTVDRRDSRGLAASLGWLARDPALRGALGAAGRERSALFGVDAMVDGYESVYANVLGAHA